MIQNSKTEFIKTLVGFSIVTWVSFIISFISAPVSTRIYSPDVLGKLNIFSTYSSLLMALVYLGLDQAYVRFYNEPILGKSNKAIFTFCILITLFALFLISIILIIFNKEISFALIEEYDIGILVLIILNAFSGIITRYINLRYRMTYNVKLYTIQGILDILIIKILYLAVGFWNPTAKPAIIMMTISRFIVTTMFLLLQRKEFEFDKSMFKKDFYSEIVKYSLPLVPITFLAWANNSISQIIMQKMLGFSKLGIYSVGVGLASIINIIQVGFSNYWTPYVYQNYKDKDNKFWQIHKILISVIIMIGLSIILFQDILFILIGEKYRQAKIFFPFLLITPISYTIALTTGLGISISKKTIWDLILFFVNTIINIILCFILIPLFDVVGAALSAAISSIFSLIIRTIVGEKYFRSIKNYRYILIGLLLLISMGFANFFLFEKVLLKMIIFSIVYFCGIIFFRKEIIYLWNNIRIILFYWK